MVEDEIKDAHADKARILWASLRAADFHNGRNRIAAALRESVADAYEDAKKAAMGKDDRREVKWNRWHQGYFAAKDDAVMNINLAKAAALAKSEGERG